MRTKLTPELQEKIIKYIKGGNYIVIACQAVGISEVTYYDWIKKGEAGREPYADYADAIKKARAEAEIRNCCKMSGVYTRYKIFEILEILI
jgi:transposase